MEEQVELSATLARAINRGALLDAIVLVRIGEMTRVYVRVIVPSSPNGVLRALMAANVTVQAVRLRLLAQLEGEPE